jgi:fengycin family lipopeptide synthetase B
MTLPNGLKGHPVDQLAIDVLEKELGAIWANVLNRDHVSSHDNFLDLGGQSLDVIRVISLISQRLGIELSLETVFEHPTVAELALTIKAPQSANSAQSPPLD